MDYNFLFTSFMVPRTGLDGLSLWPLSPEIEVEETLHPRCPGLSTPKETYMQNKMYTHMWCAASCPYSIRYTRMYNPNPSLGWQTRVRTCSETYIHTMTQTPPLWHPCLVFLFSWRKSCMHRRAFCCVADRYIDAAFQLIVQRLQINGLCMRSAVFSATDSLFLCASAITAILSVRTRFVPLRHTYLDL
jgi:hypothetical protein